ncbi:MAG: hypothetical protein COV72_03010 [Candidatus Omnitrophica bacterium CG11_big_fil_rev_8_21_14_0_20_42_13]|uniref:DUF547 domain-containing protein n=1 Tax=Candidatus Ghiorseimicrobium undicola TaxID=1974746 RepID=A0A2H0LYJ2_9BACT|nr:MAG: hypothetical protein COV72_03010 [Candidatus Omnitrophica bacterium CG11_big_fil_rev_8_21_14_0_20_42_13]
MIKRENIKSRMLISIGLTSIILLLSSLAFAFDHTYSALDQFLKRHVKDGLVDYSVIKKSPADLEKIVHELEGVTLKEYEIWSNPERMAFWINAYNIGAVKHVLDNYPLKKSFGLSALRYPANSIQQIPDVWNKPILNLLGKNVSLNEIENERLRKEFKDPRIHFVIVCASIGCPVLREEAYSAETLDGQLNEQIKEFANTPSKFRYDADKDILFLSPIFKWFGEDFDKKGGVISFLKDYVPSDMASKLSNKTRIEWQDYDWNLNEL